MAARSVSAYRRSVVAAVADAVVAVAGCTDGGSGRPDELAEASDGPNAGPIPTLPGGLELTATDPAAALVGAELAYGTPLPSEQLAAESLTTTPEVASVLARRALLVPEARHLADVIALTVEGAELFDEAALEAFHEGLVAGLTGGAARREELAGRPVVAGEGDGRSVVAWLEGDLLVLVLADTAEDARAVVTRQLEARGRGEVGSLDPVTPMALLPAEAAYVEVPNVAFAPIPPPEDEPDGPAVPGLPGATAVQGRYGVTAGERRTVVWSFALDPAAHPSAESVAPLLGPLVSSRAGGAPADAAEVVDRIVVSASGGEGEPSAAAFRHQGLVLLVEGQRADQVDAVVTAWITALGPG